MMDKEQYKQVVLDFLVELNHLTLHSPDGELRALAKLKDEIPRYLQDLQNEENDAPQALYSAFAYVDEYIHADLDRVIDTGFEAYKARTASEEKKT
jgi:hypothetical protein